MHHPLNGWDDPGIPGALLALPQRKAVAESRVLGSLSARLQWY
jgi:hypothetical protein